MILGNTNSTSGFSSVPSSSFRREC